MTFSPHDFSARLDADLADLLCCPVCRSAGLERDEDGLSCRECGTTYPVMIEAGVADLVPRDGSAVKRDIQAWWGDLYRQLYEGHEREVTSAEMERRMSTVEDLFHARRHLAVVEMPLSDLTGKKVLEIGAGGGAHSAVFKMHGASMVSVDITPERALATARKLALIRGGEGRVYQADAESLPFRDASFDIVYSNGVLHHSEDTDRCIAEVFRVLKPGGKAVLMLYARHSSVIWLNVAPRALLTGEMFRWPEAQWIGRLTEGKPKHGAVRNPITRVYSKHEICVLLSAFSIKSLRKASFQFDNICIPRMTQIRNAVLKRLGAPAMEGGIYVYGGPFHPETVLEQKVGSVFGFCWNVVAEKPPTRQEGGTDG